MPKLLKKIFKRRSLSQILLIIISFDYISKFFSDKTYLQIVWYLMFHKALNLKNPQTFNEKLQWLKLYNRRPEYTMMADKYAVRKYIADTIGEEYLIPLIGHWDSPEEINFDALPPQFVLKCNHNSGLGMCICRDKQTLNRDEVKKELALGLKQNYFLLGREYCYKNIKPCIIAEKFISNNNTEGLIDYKVLCFNGKAKVIERHAGRFSEGYTQDFYDVHWNKLSISQEYSHSPVSKEASEKPICLNKMISLSEKLAIDMPHVRIDWYHVNGKLLFGEITFFDGAGWTKFDNPEDDLYLGSLINLPKEKII